jgi:hypothetical protein
MPSREDVLHVAANRLDMLARYVRGTQLMLEQLNIYSDAWGTAIDALRFLENDVRVELTGTPRHLRGLERL